MKDALSVCPGEPRWDTRDAGLIPTPLWTPPRGNRGAGPASELTAWRWRGPFYGSVRGSPGRAEVILREGRPDVSKPKNIRNLGGDDWYSGTTISKNSVPQPRIP